MIPRASGGASWFDARLVWAAVLLACAATFACDKAALLAPTQSTISLTAGSLILPPGGSTELTAIVLENSGQPVPNGTTVRFTTTLGRIDPLEAQTRNGVATATFLAGSDSGVADIRAISGLATAPGTNTGTTPTPTPTPPPAGTPAPTTPTTPAATSSAGNAVRILVGAAGAQNVTLSATPSTVRPSGSSVEIAALVNDTNGNRLPNVPVAFSTSRGTLDPGVSNTDGSGVARSMLTASETATVTARVGSQTATLEVRSSTVASFTLATTPPSPSAGQPVSLTITPAANTAPRVVVNWGDNTNPQDIGVVSAVRAVTHIYSAPGFYTIEATGTSPEGDTFTNALPVTVAQQPPVGLTVTPTTGQIGTNFTFTITPTTGALISNIRIEYGDGATEDLGPISTQVTRQHQYSTSGTKTVTVTQTETNGNVTRASVTISVTM